MCGKKATLFVLHHGGLLLYIDVRQCGSLVMGSEVYICYKLFNGEEKSVCLSDGSPGLYIGSSSTCPVFSDSCLQPYLAVIEYRDDKLTVSWSLPDRAQKVEMESMPKQCMRSVIMVDHTRVMWGQSVCAKAGSIIHCDRLRLSVKTDAVLQTEDTDALIDVYRSNRSIDSGAPVYGPPAGSAAAAYVGSMMPDGMCPGLGMSFAAMPMPVGMRNGLGEPVEADLSSRSRADERDEKANKPDENA